MRPPVYAVGLDGRSLLLEASILMREGHVVEESPSARALISALADTGGRLVVLGPHIPDLTLPETIRRIRSDPATRNVSILAVIPTKEPVELDGQVVRAGANAVLRRPLEQSRLDTWVAKLLTVPRRVQARVPVQGQVVGTARTTGGVHFVGLTRNISVNGLLLASPVPLAPSPDVELELTLPETTPLRALGRIVREAPEVSWPYLGYGIEFLYVNEESLEAITELIRRETTPQPLPLDAGLGAHAIRSTLRRDQWIYEILEPVDRGGTWQVEIRRAPRDGWRAGSGGPFYVVEEASPEAALAAARAFVMVHG